MSLTEVNIIGFNPKMGGGATSETKLVRSTALMGLVACRIDDAVISKGSDDSLGKKETPEQGDTKPNDDNLDAEDVEPNKGEIFGEKEKNEKKDDCCPVFLINQKCQNRNNRQFRYQQETVKLPGHEQIQTTAPKKTCKKGWNGHGTEYPGRGYHFFSCFQLHF